MKKISMSAVAKAASVGVATVDRVLNNRASVRQETREKVLRAAEALGYREDLRNAMTHQSGMMKAGVRTGFILLSKDYSFYQQLCDELARLAREQGQPEPVFVWVDIDDAESVVASLETLAARVDCIGLIALDNPLIRHAIKKISAAGVHIFTLFSDLSPCGQSGYIGLDNLKAGRTAGWFAERLLEQQGVIGVLLGDHRFNCQESCEISFRSYLRESKKALRVLEPLKTHESIAGGYEATVQLLEQHPDIALIYAPCGGIEGVLDALADRARPEIKIVCHGPFVGDEMALIAGRVEVMLRHRIDAIAAQILSVFIHSHRHREGGSRNTMVPFDVITRENL